MEQPGGAVMAHGLTLSIPLEISVRELQGHLLLAVEAAARGHQVVLAATNDLWLYRRLRLLPPGPYVVKNVNLSAASVAQYDAYLRDGFTVFALEQEPSILWESFDRFLEDCNITAGQPLPFAGVACWGQRDTECYRALFPAAASVFVETGSPRADLWMPRFADVRRNRRAPDGRPYLLLVANFGYWMGETHWSSWLARARGNEVLQSHAQEEGILRFLLEDSAVMLHMIRAVRDIAVRRPDLRIVIRPHPLDHPPHWHHVAGELSNVEVSDARSPLSDWIAGAAVVLQNGCTSAIEAVVQEVPLVTFGPERREGNLSIPGHLGLRVASLDALDTAVTACMTPGAYAREQERSAAIIAPLVTVRGDAASRMVSMIEDRSGKGDRATAGRREVLALQAVRAGKGTLDEIRVRGGRLARSSGAAIVDVERARQDVAVMARILGYPVPRVTRLSSTGILVAPSRRVG